MRDIEYIRAEGLRCPYCAKAEVEGGPVEIEGAKAFQPCTCLACGKEWTAYYLLGGWTAPR